MNVLSWRQRASPRYSMGFFELRAKLRFVDVHTNYNTQFCFSKCLMFESALMLTFKHFSLFSEIHATGFNYQNEDEKVTLSFPSTLQKGKGPSSKCRHRR